MNYLMQNNNSFKNIPIFNKGCLAFTDNLVSNRCDPINQQLGENFKVHIEKANGPILFNCVDFFHLRHKGYHSII
jgi:hypothetical protein